MNLIHMVRTALFDAGPTPSVAVAGPGGSAAARDVLTPERGTPRRRQSLPAPVGVPPAVALRSRAMVIDPSRQARAFISEALSSFEPGFVVVTAEGPEQAGEWIDTFPPDLLVVNPADAPGAVADFVADVVSRPEARHCKVLVVGGRRLADGGRVDAVLQRDANLSELLRTVHRVWTGGGVNAPTGTAS